MLSRVLGRPHSHQYLRQQIMQNRCFKTFSFPSFSWRGRESGLLELILAGRLSKWEVSTLLCERRGSNEQQPAAHRHFFAQYCYYLASHSGRMNGRVLVHRSNLLIPLNVHYSGYIFVVGAGWTWSLTTAAFKIEAYLLFYQVLPSPCVGAWTGAFSAYFIQRARLKSHIHILTSIFCLLHPE